MEGIVHNRVTPIRVNMSEKNTPDPDDPNDRKSISTISLGSGKPF